MHKLDNPQRRLEMPPLKTLKLLGLTKGDVEERIPFEDITGILSKKGYCDINKHLISENFYGVTARKPSI